MINVKQILVLGLVMAAMAACQKPQGFDYRDIRNVKVENVGFNQTVLSMDLIYFNPNSFGVDLKKVDCDVYINNSYLGKYQLDTLMHIPRRAEFDLPSKIIVDMQSVLKNGMSLLFSQEVLVNVKGTTRVGKAGIFATVPFNYEARHKLSLF